jgi:hypothetical protein
MASLFSGTPQTATSYVTSSSEAPKWMQDAIYNQIQWSTNLAQKPYEPYTGTTVAGLTPEQQQAYQSVQQNQGAWQPALTTATTGTQNIASGPGAMAAAAPYLAKAGESSVADIGNYMNPYTTNVTDQIARLGARNLSENLLPGVSDAFVRAGQFGSGRMGEFGSRALRDTQDSVLAQQSQALQSGYGQALGASSADLSRQAGLASTTGSMAGADLARQQSALAQIADLSKQRQQMGYVDSAALEASGAAQQGQTQREADAARQQYQTQLDYPRSTLDWLSTQIRGMAPNVQTVNQSSTQGTGQTYSASPLSQLATGLSAGAGIYNLATRPN